MTEYLEHLPTLPQCLPEYFEHQIGFPESTQQLPSPLLFSGGGGLSQWVVLRIVNTLSWGKTGNMRVFQQIMASIVAWIPSSNNLKQPPLSELSSSDIWCNRVILAIYLSSWVWRKHFTSHQEALTKKHIVQLGTVHRTAVFWKSCSENHPFTRCMFCWLRISRSDLRVNDTTTFVCSVMKSNINSTYQVFGIRLGGIRWKSDLKLRYFSFDVHMYSHTCLTYTADIYVFIQLQEKKFSLVYSNCEWRWNEVTYATWNGGSNRVSQILPRLVFDGTLVPWSST